jgi:hypothetical protein
MKDSVPSVTADMIPEHSTSDTPVQRKSPSDTADGPPAAASRVKPSSVRVPVTVEWRGLTIAVPSQGSSTLTSVIVGESYLTIATTAGVYRVRLEGPQ